MIIDLLSKLPPGGILIVGALLLPFLKGNANKIWGLLLPLLSFWHLLSFESGYIWEIQVFDYTLMPIRIDALSLVWGYVFHIAAFLATVYALHIKDNLQSISGLIYAGSAIGATFSGDLATLFLFWEATAISSVFLIWAEGTHTARRAGIRYLIIQVASGVLLLGGTVIQLERTGSLLFGEMQLGDGVSSLLIFLAFGIKAAFPLLHSWLKDSYPSGTVTGTVFLSAFTTKLAIYALARSFAGEDLLILLGAMMTVFPIFYAVIENDLRRVLSYSLNNQLGFMVVGVGIGSELALNGTAAHAFAHIIYKALLFMSMGAVLHRTGTIKASELGGLYKSMPLTAFFCIIGSLSISGFPGFSGFVTKSMTLSAAIVDFPAEWIGYAPLLTLVLLFASAGVVDHSGIKIPFFSFFFHDSGKRVKEAPLNMLLAMGACAFLCIAIGLFPMPLYHILPYPAVAVEYSHHLFDYTHIISSLQLLFFAALAFVVLLRTGIYPPEVPSINLDIGWVYRRAFPSVLKYYGKALDGGYAAFSRTVWRVAGWVNRILSRQFSPGGTMGEPWSTSQSTLWAALLLALYLLSNFISFE